MCFWFLSGEICEFFKIWRWRQGRSGRRGEHTFLYRDSVSVFVSKAMALWEGLYVVVDGAKHFLGSDQ